MSFGHFGRNAASRMSADRVFWIVDNGSSHRGQAAIDRLTAKYPNAIMVHTPIHASWLNQVEIYFSIAQRKVLSPNDFTDLTAVSKRLADFAERDNQNATPFQWKFTAATPGRALLRQATSDRGTTLTVSSASRAWASLSRTGGLGTVPAASNLATADWVIPAAAANCV